jgi:cytochrome P450
MMKLTVLISSVASQLPSNPALANGLLFTTAVIKETLRLFPPASSNRQGTPGVEITDDTGMVCPTNGAVV